MPGTDAPRNKAAAIFVTLRPRQWVKNAFVLAPLIFAQKLLDTELAVRESLAVLIFCALSGAVYAFNDVRDVEADRAHPIKSKRPIAAREISIRQATLLSAILAFVGLGGALALDPTLALIAAGYLANNLAYSIFLKRIAFLDVLMIAGGFLLRVLGGAAAIDVPVSSWLLLCTTLLAAFLGFGKRAHELAQRSDAVESRAALSGYSLSSLQFVMLILAIGTSAAYALYTRDAHTVEVFETDRLIWTLPFCIVGIARFLQLALWAPRPEPPTDAMLRDWPFVLNIVAWGATVLATIYW